MLFAIMFLCGTIFAQQNGSSPCVKNEAAFHGMLNKTRIKSSPLVKFDICNENMDQKTITTEQTKMAIKVWFTDEMGNVYHPAKHRFNPKEKFDIWVETSCPIYIALFQNYLEDRPTTKTVYPKENYVNTYKPIPAGVAFKLPVMFAMDDDMRTEIMSIVAARADFNVTAVNNVVVPPTQSITSTVIGDNNNVVNTIVNASDSAFNTPVTQETTGDATVIKSLKNFNLYTHMARKSSVKFDICSGNSIVDTSGKTVEHSDEVCLILFGSSKLAQYQLTLYK